MRSAGRVARRAVMAAGLAGVLTITVLSCSGGSSPSAASSSSSSEAPITAPSGPLDCASGTGFTPGSGGAAGPTPSIDQTPATGSDPFQVSGARQKLGPSTTTTTIPPSPATAVVQRPPNPDEGSPALATVPPDTVEGQAAGAPVVVHVAAQSGTDSDDSTTTSSYPVEVEGGQLCGAGGGDP